MVGNKLFDTTKSQSGLLPVVLVVVGLVSIAVVFNQVNITGFFASNESNQTDVPTTTTENPIDTTQETNPVIAPETAPVENITTVETPSTENIIAPPPEKNVTPDTGLNITQTETPSLPATNEAVLIENVTTQPIENVAQNVTQPVNKTENATTNETIPTEPSEIIPIEPVPMPTPENPILNVTIDYPAKITRGELVNVKANVTNTGADANNVVLTWQLPSGFEIISGKQETICGTLASGSSCISEISVSTSFSTKLGKNGIKVVVNYG